MTTDERNIQAVCSALRAGRPVILPTDTVCGVGVAVHSCDSPALLYDLKQRPHDKPIAWLVGSVDDISRYGRDVPEFALALARTFWPGALTLVVKASAEVPQAYQSSEGTIGLRMPNAPAVLDVIDRIHSPLAVTSANFSGAQAAGLPAAIDAGFVAAVPVALDSAVETSGLSSTVLDCTADHPIMLREGSITVADIQAQS